MQRVRDFYHGKPKQTHRERQESPHIKLRKFNNLIKSMVISDAVNAVTTTTSGADAIVDSNSEGTINVLDMCGGTGGDLSKFQHHRRIRRVTLVDISASSVEEARRRYQEGRAKGVFRFEAEFFCLDAFSWSAMEPIIKQWGPFHLINCQFALHYGLTTAESRAETFRILAAALAPGGRMVATVPNVEYIVDNLMASEIDPYLLHLDRRPLYEVHVRLAKDSEDVEYDMREYTFTMGDMVQQVPEPFVYRIEIEAVAKKHGLHAVRWETLREYVEAWQDRGHDDVSHRLVDQAMSLMKDAAPDLYVVVEWIPSAHNS